MQSSQAKENGWANEPTASRAAPTSSSSHDWPSFSGQREGGQSDQPNQDVSNTGTGILMEFEWRDRRLGTGVPYEDAKGMDLSNLPVGSRLYLNNLPRCTRNDIFELFGRHGRVLEIVLYNSYGYVQYEKVQDCRRALAAEQGGMFMGNRLELDICRDQPSYIIGNNTQDDYHSKKRYDHYDSSRRDSTSRSGDDREYHRYHHHRDSLSSNGGSKSRSDDRERSIRDDRDRDRRDKDRDRERIREKDYDNDRDRERGRDKDRRREIDDDRHRRRRSPPTYHRDTSKQRGSSRSPTRWNKGSQTESNIYLPFRYGNMVPYCQILAIDHLERRFVGPIEKLFRQSDIQLHIYQMPQNSVGPQDIKRLIMEGVQAVIFLKKHHQESGMVTLQVFDPEAKVGDEKIGCDEYQQLEPRDAVEIVRRHKELRKKILEAREQQENKETREELARTRRARSPEPPRTYTRKASDSQGNHAPSMLPPPPTPPTPPAPPSLPAAPPQYSTPVAQLALPAIPMQPTTSTMQPAAQVQAAGLNSALLSMLTGAQPMAPNTMGPGANLLQLLSLMQNIPPQLLQQLTQAQAGMMSMMPQANATPVTTMPGFSQAQMTPQGILTTVPASLSSTQPSSMPHPLAPVSSLATSVNGYVTQTPSQPSAPQQAPQPTQQFSQQQQQQQQLQQQPSQPPPPPQQQQQAPQSSIPLHQAAPQQSQSVEGKEAEAPVAQSPSQSNQNNSRVADILKQLALLQKQSPTQR